ncbi:hypothetical protein [Actinoplanes sp. NPDC049802]|uniref:hypothetical protein n=1 Tax=Actinoplanes sp. NPDC049802 TaxID=3154742 RepID=UPI0033D7538F
MTSQGTYLTTVQVAEKLRDAGFTVTPAQIRRWVSNGRFTGVRRLPNGRAQIPASEVDAIVTGTPA